MQHLNILLLASMFGAPPETVPENLTRIDSQQAAVEWSGGRWQIRIGAETLKDFDRQETDAREALRIMRDLKLTQFGTIGSPRPTLEYWLSNGRAPTNSISGLHALPFDRENLRVEQVLGQWCVRDGRRILFSFGSHADDARQALAIIRKYGFDQVGYLGRPAPVMVYFLSANGSAASHAALTAPNNLAKANAEQNPFPRRILQAKDEGMAGKQAPTGDETELAAMPSIRQMSSTRAAATGSNDDRVAIDWRRVQVRQNGPGWELAYGNYVLANLGPSENSAHVALAVVQHFRFTEHCLIGRPKVNFSFFLSNGQAPHGLCGGARNTPLRVDALAVRQVDGEWVIADAGRAVFHFGNNDQDARDALQAIRKYHFDCLCQVGTAEAPLRFLIRSR